MKRFLSARILVAACLLAALTAPAASLQRAQVIKEPLWVLHVDADALRPSALGQHLLAELDKPEAQKKLAAFRAIFNIDPRKDLHDVTLYGVSKAEEDGVVLVRAEFDAGHLTTLVEGAKEHVSTRHGKYTIHNWVDENKKEKDGIKPRTFAAIHGKTVIFGQKESRVVEALDVLDGVKPNLGANPQFAQFGDGAAFIQGAARKLDLPANDPNAAVLKQAKLLTLKVAENQRKLEATLKLDTESETVAKQVEAIGRGLIAVLSLQREKPEALKLSQGLEVQQTGAAVTVKLALPSDEVVEMIKAAEARKKAAQAKN